MSTEWLQLLKVKRLPVAAKRKLVAALGSPAAALDADRATVAGIVGERKRPLPALTRADVDADLETLARLGGGFVGFTDPDFPPLLNQIHAAPLGLFVVGERALLASPQLAIVGSRQPTPTGVRATMRFAAQLAAAGLTVTSGMARGIDCAAHRGCLDSGGGTVAVLATGVDVVYPRDFAGVHREIAERGLIVSEYPPGAPPKRKFFPQRNRIISGLSLGVLVVEAGVRSGSLITARLAGEQGREVFAVPGSIHSPVSRGCHRLLKQGAKLVEEAGDVLEELGHVFVPTVVGDGDGDGDSHGYGDRAGDGAGDGDAARLYDMIDFTPAAMDALIAQSGLTADKVSYILTELELRGLIAATAGGYQRLPQ